MQRRKVIQQGKGTLTMSLPSVWTRDLGIKAGDDLFVEERGATLVISPTISKAGRSTDITVSGVNRGLLFIILHNLYVRGDDEMRLRYDPAQYEDIVEAVKGLLGFEIVEQTKNICLIKELARGDGEEFDQILRRVFLLLLSMADDGFEAMAHHENTALQAVQKRDEQVNTLVRYSLRMLNKRTCNNLQKSMHLYALLTLLENLGDEYSRLYRIGGTDKQKTLKLAGRIAQLLRKFYTLFYAFDMQKAAALIKERAEIRAEIDKTLKMDPLALQHLRRIADLIVDIEKFHLAMQL